MIWMLLIFTISNCGFTLARKYSTEKTNFHILSLVVKTDFTVRPLINKTDKNNWFGRFSIKILCRKLVDPTEIIQHWRFFIVKTTILDGKYQFLPNYTRKYVDFWQKIKMIHDYHGIFIDHPETERFWITHFWTFSFQMLKRMFSECIRVKRMVLWPLGFWFWSVLRRKSGMISLFLSF